MIEADGRSTRHRNSRKPCSTFDAAANLAVLFYVNSTFAQTDTLGQKVRRQFRLRSETRRGQGRPEVELFVRLQKRDKKESDNTNRTTTIGSMRPDYRYIVFPMKISPGPGQMNRARNWKSAVAPHIFPSV
jgi:hypothetical protein